MKIAQFHDEHTLRLGIIEGDNLLPIQFKGTMKDFIASGEDPRPAGKPVPLPEVRLAPPIRNPSKIIAVGLNYGDHAEESKGKVPPIPLLFAKFPNTLIGHRDPIDWDTHVTKKVDFEAELAVIIGKRVKACSEKEAMASVFGYTCANDVSARDLQFGDGQWVRGKSLDTFCPLGPWIVTKDEIRDPQSLKIQCRVNEKLMQDSNTGQMIFPVSNLIRFISKHFTLNPGDIILTGTPSGVGSFRDPPIYLKNGDEVMVEIERIGRLVNKCRTI
jgi:2-keto-4-pentenoate hydratase/2-oxohepta-3-ene-1,7-dioic acid hydratase in catechol pathway